MKQPSSPSVESALFYLSACVIACLLLFACTLGRFAGFEFRCFVAAFILILIRSATDIRRRVILPKGTIRADLALTLTILAFVIHCTVGGLVVNATHTRFFSIGGMVLFLIAMGASLTAASFARKYNLKIL